MISKGNFCYTCKKLWYLLGNIIPCRFYVRSNRIEFLTFLFLDEYIQEYIQDSKSFDLSFFRWTLEEQLTLERGFPAFHLNLIFRIKIPKSFRSQRTADRSNMQLKANQVLSAIASRASFVTSKRREERGEAREICYERGSFSDRNLVRLLFFETRKDRSSSWVIELVI